MQLAEAKKKIQNTLCQHIEIDVERDYHLYAIDVTPNPRPYAKKVEDRGYIKHNEVVNSGKPVTIGHNYSCVLYLTGQGTWALPLAIDRVSTSEKDTVFGVKQWCEIIKDENNHFTDKRCVGVFDAAYSSAYCIAALTTISQAMLFLSHVCVLIGFYNVLTQASKISKVAPLSLIKALLLILKMKQHGVSQHSHLLVIGRPKKASNTLSIFRYGMALGCVP